MFLFSHIYIPLTFKSMQTPNQDNQSKNNISKKSGMNFDSMRMDEEKKTQPKEDVKMPGNGNDKKTA
jgi:hypothetical protein